MATQRSASHVLALVVATVALGGCAWLPRWPWFGRKPEPPTPILAQPAVDVRPAAEMYAACPNYAQALAASSFPRGAIIRGLDSGHATVRFVVDGADVTVLSVTATDPAFGDEATTTVRRFACRVERPAVFEMPFDWRSGR